MPTQTKTLFSLQPCHEVNGVDLGSLFVECVLDFDSEEDGDAEGGQEDHGDKGVVVDEAVEHRTTEQTHEADGLNQIENQYKGIENRQLIQKLLISLPVK